MDIIIKILENLKIGIYLCEVSTPKAYPIWGSESRTEKQTTGYIMRERTWPPIKLYLTS